MPTESSILPLLKMMKKGDFWLWIVMITGCMMKDAINANMNESKRISHFTQLLFFQPPVDAEQMLEVFFDELLLQPPNA